jgi:hypothetical protein
VKRIFALVAVISIAVGGYVHFRLWHGVYRHAPIREMFVANFVASAIVAVAVLLSRRVFAVAGAAISAGSLTALVLSRTVGLPTFHGRWTEIGLAPGQSVLGINETLVVIIAESVALLACASLLVLTFRSRIGVDGRRRNAPPPQPQWVMPPEWAIPLPE